MSDPALSGLVAAFGHTLLHFLWQGALVGACAALALRLLRDARPQARYLVLCIALLACAGVPLATFVAQLVPVSHEPTLLRTFATLDVPGTTALSAAIATSTQRTDATPWLVALWSCGAAFLVLRLATGLAWIRRQRSMPAAGALQQRVDALAQRLAVKRRVTLYLVDALDTPVSSGWLRPAILLPRALPSRMSPEQVDALLAHELAHVRRHDFPVNVLQGFVEALLFFHPIVWWLSRRIRAEREHVADALATHACAPRCLATALSELADLQRTFATPRVALAAYDGALLPRVERLVRPPAPARATGRIALALFGLATACGASLTYAQVAHLPTDTYRQTLGLVRHDTATYSVWGPHDPLVDYVAARAQGTDRDVLYVYRAGAEYRVADAALVARARAAWDAVDATQQQLDEVARRIDALTARDQSAADALREYQALERTSAAAVERLERELPRIADEAFDRGLAAPP